MYYICKFSDSWSIYDSTNSSSQPIEKNEIEVLKKLLPGLLNDNSKILLAIQINSIQPNKLLNLTGKEKTVATKK